MILGHSSPAVTRRIYAHVMKRATAEQVERVTQLLTRHRHQIQPLSSRSPRRAGTARVRVGRMKIGVYVDGYNLYYGARGHCGRSTAGWRWLDIRALAELLVGRRQDWAGGVLDLRHFTELLRSEHGADDRVAFLQRRRDELLERRRQTEAALTVLDDKIAHYGRPTA